MRSFKPAPLPPDLERVRDIEWFEGPLLSEFKDSEGHPWLVKWVDCDKTANRWLFLRVSATVIEGYMQGKLDLRKVVLGSRFHHVGAPCPPGEPWLAVDIDSDGARVAAWHIDVLPEEYLPPPTAFYDPELAPMPTDDTLFRMPQRHRVHIDSLTNVRRFVADGGAVGVAIYDHEVANTSDIVVLLALKTEEAVRTADPGRAWEVGDAVRAVVRDRALILKNSGHSDRLGPTEQGYMGGRRWELELESPSEEDTLREFEDTVRATTMWSEHLDQLYSLATDITRKQIFFVYVDMLPMDIPDLVRQLERLGHARVTHAILSEDDSISALPLPAAPPKPPEDLFEHLMQDDFI